MALFDVPGWSMPADIKPVGDVKSRKRKRGAAGNASSKLHDAEVNVEKLMERLADAQGKPQQKEKHMKKRTDKSPQKKSREVTEVEVEDEGRHRATTSASVSNSEHKTKKKKNKNLDRSSSSNDAETGAAGSAGPRQSHPRKAEASKVKHKEHEAREQDVTSMRPKNSANQGSADAHLTGLQSKMKQSLEGARFRWINETLYKSNSQEAQRLMHEDPKVFEEYHAGFRHQVTSWPTNPVDHFIKSLSSYPERTVTVDLGCGDAALAQKLVPKGYTVLSFDLVSANSFIVAADICGKLPIPGSDSEDEGQVVDVVVCCLSLMSTNWLSCIREARRVLKKGGELKIAEVASRFTNVDEFTSVICSVGFHLVSKNERNSHFTLFDFKKSEDSKNLDDKVWGKILARGDVLQPCEYKRR